MNIFEHHLSEIRKIIISEKESLKLQNIENLYSIQDFQYQNRPIFLILAWLIYKFINLFNSDINQIFSD